MEVTKDRESTLRKQLLNCKIQSEFLSSMIRDLENLTSQEENEQ
jgi:hypothetical protein